MREQMDYTIVESAFIIIGGTLILAILFREAHEWWLTRDVRRSQKAIRQLQKRYYDEMKDNAVKYAENLYKEMGRR